MYYTTQLYQSCYYLKILLKIDKKKTILRIFPIESIINRVIIKELTRKHDVIHYDSLFQYFLKFKHFTKGNSCS